MDTIIYCAFTFELSPWSIVGFALPKNNFLVLFTALYCNVPIIANGKADKTSVKLTHNVTYSCDEGHALVGNPTPTCQADGALTSVPFCDASEYHCAHVP